MDLLERYLNSVKFWLPASQRDDIARELSGDLRSQVEERQAELGHPLNDAEVETILKRWGQPLAVAARYLPERYLIGPVLYPAYLFALKLVGLIYVLPWLLVWIGLTLFSPGYRAEHADGALAPLWSLLHVALWLFFLITMAFAYVQRYTLQTGRADDWSANELPAAHESRQIPLFDSIVELAVSLAVAMWWLNLRSVHGLWTTNQDTSGFTLAPIWQYLYWPIFALLAAGIVLGAVSLIWRRRTPVHIGLSLAQPVLCLVLIGILLSAGNWIVVTAPDQDPEKIAQLHRWANISLLVTLGVIGIACLASIYCDVRRLLGDAKTLNLRRALD